MKSDASLSCLDLSCQLQESSVVLICGADCKKDLVHFQKFFFLIDFSNNEIWQPHHSKVACYSNEKNKTTEMKRG